MSPPTIELEGLRVRLGAREILKGLDTRLDGRAIGLLGPNGAGKTTLINTILGFFPPASGRARVLGLDVHTEGRAVRRLIGYMPENEAFVPGLSVVGFVRLMGELSGLPPESALERAHEVLHYVGLGDVRYRRVEQLSLGMKQLAKLAQAIVHGPRLVILDEPTNGLDPPHRLRMLELVREIRDSGHTRVMLSSHLLRDVEECCGEVLILKDGTIAAYRDLDAERKAEKRVIELEIKGANGDFRESVVNLGCSWEDQRRSRIRLELAAGVEVADIFRLASEKRVQLRRVAFKRDSLEEIFLAAMGDERNGRP
ncbi:MAG: ABC transporter ATP-binding protein [Acidobacteria bacterium]|nr:ABC transporter ATP-binding protein [Acidobacteriota bacterium]